jgi:hypothetical protein
MDEMMPPMGKGPGGSNDVSGYLNQARADYQAGRITKQQYLDRLDYYAPAAPVRMSIGRQQY